ncbi:MULTISPECIES: tetratricopeptide repeat protein [Colwellia]|uniref:Tetratricopeptide repeat protein n=1 Tax=Colwellia marinimaniae TaxID=1513592 RepID=A0ABQ0MTU3_9GAMM|nr:MULTISPECIES: tetratricopeptide repeat protein [Colwellia]GAW95802.1 hypothetical protein MTCD1_01405 [Colwellia marinimaniae]
MQLLKLFISSIGGKPVFPSAKIVVTAITLSLCLGACASKPVVDNSQQESVATAVVTDKNQSITESKAKEKHVNSNHVKSGKAYSKSVPAINRYLLQQQAKQATAVPAKVLKDYQQALSLMKAKKWRQAQALFDQVILKQPQLSGSYVNKAIMAKQQGQLVPAQLLLDKALAVNDLNLYAHHLQGQVYRLQGQFDKAEQSYLAALAIWPDFAEAHASMAILLELYRGRLLAAHGYYRSYLLLKSDDDEVKRWLAGLEIKLTRAGLDVPSAEQSTLQIVKPQSTELQSVAEQTVDNQTASPSKELNHG